MSRFKFGVTAEIEADFVLNNNPREAQLLAAAVRNFLDATLTSVSSPTKFTPISIDVEVLEAEDE